MPGWIISPNSAKHLHRNIRVCLWQQLFSGGLRDSLPGRGHETNNTLIMCRSAPADHLKMKERMNSKFLENLKETGWREISEDWEYRKNNWFIFRDTSSWWMAGTINNPRVFDVPEPNGNERWTINLIEHLCKCDDELNLLRENNYSPEAK
jgi:hypothetical protein